jgi:hypothetical protein
VDARARRARDKFAPREILFRVRGRIVDNPALDTQARVRAMEENRGQLANLRLGPGRSTATGRPISGRDNAGEDPEGERIAY